MKKNNKVVAVILAILMVAHSFPIAVFAADVPAAAESDATAPSAPQESISSPTDNTAPDEQVDEEDGDSVDLGNDQAELDANKDFTGVVRQSKPYTCGPASLATLMTQLGNDTSEEEVLQYITDLSEEKGVSLLSLKVAGEKLGSRVQLKHWSAEQVLGYIKETQDPVLIHDEKKGVGGHFSVIREYDAEKGIVELSDTEAGNIKYSEKDFEHIYTGDALVIYEGEATGMVADEATNLSDEVAATIWGKYVPVSVIAAGNGNDAVKKAATKFADCTKSALNLSTAAQRTAQRKICYSDLAKAIGDNLGNPSELGFMAEYNLKGKVDDGLAALGFKAEQTKDVAGQLGTDSILGILKGKLADNQSKLSSYQSQVVQKRNTLSQTDPVQYAKKLSLQTQMTAKNTSYTNAASQKTLIESALNPKTATANQLQSEINSGAFTQNGQTFALGAVGNQVVAQSATYAKLSANLTARLSSLNGQITQAQKSLSSAQSNYNSFVAQAASYQSQATTAYNGYNSNNQLTTQYRSSATAYYNQYNQFNSQASSYQSQATAAYNNYSSYARMGSRYAVTANSYLSQYNTYNAQASSARSQASAALNNYNNSTKLSSQYQTAATTYLNQYNSYSSQAQNAKSNASYWQGQISAINNQIASYTSQKDSAQTEVKSASAEVARLQRLKTFGDQEVQRKKTVLATLQSEMKSLQAQLDKTNATIAQLKTDIASLQSQYAPVANAQPPLSQSQINQLNADITSLNTQIAILTTEIAAQQAEIAGEANFERSQSDSAEISGTRESMMAVSNGLDELKSSLSKPGTIIKIAGVTLVVIGGAALCVATAPACATALAYGGAIVGTGFTINGIKIITTQSNIFGTPVSDTEWGKAVVMFPVDVIGTVLSVSALKSILVAKYGAIEAENLGAVMTRGSSAEVEAVKTEIAPVVKTGQAEIAAAAKVGSSIRSSELTFSADKIIPQMAERGWTKDSVKALIDNPFTMREAVNKTVLPNNPATVFYAKNGTYVSIDNLTKAVIQVTDNVKVLNGNWIPDSSIINPYKP